MRFQPLLRAVIGLLKSEDRVTYCTLKNVLGVDEAFRILGPMEIHETATVGVSLLVGRAEEVGLLLGVVNRSKWPWSRQF